MNARKATLPPTMPLPTPYPAISPWQWPPDAPQPANFAQEAAGALAVGDGPAAAFALAQRDVARLAAMLERYADGEADRVAATGEVRGGAFGVAGARLRLAHLAHALLAQVETILQELEAAHLSPQSPASTAAAKEWNAELRAGQQRKMPWNAGGARDGVPLHNVIPYYPTFAFFLGNLPVF